MLLSFVGGVVVLGLEGGAELDAGLEERAGFADGFERAVEFDWPVQYPLPSIRWVLAAQPGHQGSDRVGGQHLWLTVEGFDLVGDGEVLLGAGAVGDPGVTQGHVQAAVAKHRGDCLQGHAAVDGLGGQGVPQLVGVDVAEPCGGAGLVDAEAGSCV